MYNRVQIQRIGSFMLIANQLVLVSVQAKEVLLISQQMILQSLQHLFHNRVRQILLIKCFLLKTLGVLVMSNLELNLLAITMLQFLQTAYLPNQGKVIIKLNTIVQIQVQVDIIQHCNRLSKLTLVKVTLLS